MNPFIRLLYNMKEIKVTYVCNFIDYWLGWEWEWGRKNEKCLTYAQKSWFSVKFLSFFQLKGNKDEDFFEVFLLFIHIYYVMIIALAQPCNDNSHTLDVYNKYMRVIIVLFGPAFEMDN